MKRVIAATRCVSCWKPPMRFTKTSSMMAPTFASAPSQWSGSVPEMPPESDWVRRAPKPSKFQTWPSSRPSGWHDAHETGRWAKSGSALNMR